MQHIIPYIPKRNPAIPSAALPPAPARRLQHTIIRPLVILNRAALIISSLTSSEPRLHFVPSGPSSSVIPSSASRTHAVGQLELLRLAQLLA